MSTGIDLGDTCAVCGKTPAYEFDLDGYGSGCLCVDCMRDLAADVDREQTVIANAIKKVRKLMFVGVIIGAILGVILDVLLIKATIKDGFNPLYILLPIWVTCSLGTVIEIIVEAKSEYNKERDRDMKGISLLVSVLLNIIFSPIKLFTNLSKLNKGIKETEYIKAQAYGILANMEAASK